MLIDRFNRPISYLRISLTPVCNLRCVYCMPPEGIPAPKNGELLTNDEILSLVRLAASEGVRRVRLTGGEPLLRRGVVDLVRGLAATPGIEEVSLTTNGLLLEKFARPLAEAGLARVNVSLDTLDPDKFWRITRGGRLGKVLVGISAAENAGLTPVKLNTVVIRGVNDDELLALAHLTLEQPWHVRFIELMPLGNLHDWGEGFPPYEKRFLSVLEMKATLASLGMEPDHPPQGNGPARTFRIPDALGTVGFISPLGEHFCATCNRLRLTADGRLRPCLLMDAEVEIRDALRAGHPLMPHFQQALAYKPEGHEILMGNLPALRRMVQIGG